MTITKNDHIGLLKTLKSTVSLLVDKRVEQLIIDGSNHTIQTKNELTVKNNYPTVKYFIATKDGISNSFNQGIFLSKGKWVWFLNDIFTKRLSPSALINILSASSAKIIFFEIVGQQSRMCRPHPPLWSRWPFVENWFPFPAAMIRRGLIIRAGGFSPNYKIAMDYDLWWRLLKVYGPIDTVSIPITIFDETGISSTKLRQASREHLNCLIKNIPTLLAMNISNVRHQYYCLKTHLLNSFIKS